MLALSSSPRISGNSDLLLDEFLHGIRDGSGASDYSVEKVYLAELQIAACTQCDHCRQAGLCPLQDDMQPLYARLSDADAVVLASPIYFMAHCAQAKLLIDRCQVFWARKYILKQEFRPSDRPRRRGVFIAVGATHGPKVFAGAKLTVKWWLDSLEAEYWGDLLIEGVDGRGAIREHPTALAQAYELGQRFCRLDS